MGLLVYVSLWVVVKQKMAFDVRSLLRNDVCLITRVLAPYGSEICRQSSKINTLRTPLGSSQPSSDPLVGWGGMPIPHSVPYSTPAACRTVWAAAAKYSREMSSVLWHTGQSATVAKKFLSWSDTSSKSWFMFIWHCCYDEWYYTRQWHRTCNVHRLHRWSC